MSSQNRAGSRGLTIDSSCLFTQPPIIFFEHLKGSHTLNLKKQVSTFRAKKVWSLFLCGVRYQKLRGALRHALHRRPCDDTPNAATVTVTTCGVLLLSSKNIIFCFHTPHYGPWPEQYSTSHYGTPTKRQVQNVRLQNVWFQNVRFQNVRFTKRQVYKTQVSKCLISKRPVFKFNILIKQKV